MFAALRMTIGANGQKKATPIATGLQNVEDEDDDEYENEALSIVHAVPSVVAEPFRFAGSC
jgi:hypothetical protein